MPAYLLASGLALYQLSLLPRELPSLLLSWKLLENATEDFFKVLGAMVGLFCLPNLVSHLPVTSQSLKLQVNPGRALCSQEGSRRAKATTALCLPHPNTPAISTTYAHILLQKNLNLQKS